MKKLLVVLSRSERDHFFSGIPMSLLESLEIDFLLEEINEQEAFKQVLRTYKPDILLGGWDMLPLPLSAVRGNGGSVRYFCYLCGSLYKKLTREHFESGLKVTNWGKSIAPYVAECSLLLILCCLRQVGKYGYNLKSKGEWRPRITGNRSLYGKRVGLHGFGSIAQNLVPLLKPFHCEIYADTAAPNSLLKAYDVKRSPSTYDLFYKSEVLVELKSIFDERQSPVDETLLRALSDGACFVGVNPEPVVDEEALLRVAKERNIQVGLDSFKQVPLPLSSPLRELENVMMLPSMGGETLDRGLLCGEIALRNLRNYLSRKPLENKVNEETFIRST